MEEGSCNESIRTSAGRAVARNLDTWCPSPIGDGTRGVAVSVHLRLLVRAAGRVAVADEGAERARPGHVDAVLAERVAGDEGAAAAVVEALAEVRRDGVVLHGDAAAARDV